MVAEKVSHVSRREPHDSTLFINVLTIGSDTTRRVDQRRVSFGWVSAWFDVE